MKHHRIKVLFFMVPVVFFALFTALYGLPLVVVAYAFSLSAFVVAVLEAYDLYKNRQVTSELQRIEGQIQTKSMWLSPLPAPRDSLEALSFSLIERAQVNHTNDLLDHREKLRDLSDAYALWVHQIKTPISALDVLLQNDEDSERNRQMKIEVFKIEHYVDMALQMMRLDTDSHDLSIEEVSLNTMVVGMVKKYRSLFIEKRLGVQMNLPEVTLLTDEKWFSVLLEQIISNAVKYTKEGTIEITYMEAPYPTLVVRDPGIGIAPSDLPRVFEKGFTGFTGRSDLRATGIGLYLAKKAADVLGIDIKIESELGVGTRVSLLCVPYNNVRIVD